MLKIKDASTIKLKLLVKTVKDLLFAYMKEEKRFAENAQADKYANITEKGLDANNAMEDLFASTIH